MKEHNSAHNSHLLTMWPSESYLSFLSLSFYNSIKWRGEYLPYEIIMWVKYIQNVDDWNDPWHRAPGMPTWLLGLTQGTLTTGSVYVWMWVKMGLLNNHLHTYFLRSDASSYNALWGNSPLEFQK